MIRVKAWPPAVVYTRPVGGDRWGKARGPFVAVPHDAPEHLTSHELHHVRQWWQITGAAAFVLAALAAAVPTVPWAVICLAPGAMGALTWAAPWFRFRSEAAAYAVSARVAPARLDQFARALASGYGLEVTVEECRSAILSRVR